MKPKTTFRPRSYKKGEYKIHLMFNYGYKVTDPLKNKVTYQPLEYSTGISIKSEFWDSENSRILNSCPKAKTLNLELANLEEAALKIFERFQDEGVVPSPHQLREALDKKLDRKENKPVEKLRVVDFINAYVEKTKARGVSERTYINYSNCANRLSEFEQSIGKAITFDVFDVDMILEFYGYLKLTGYYKGKKHKNYTLNSIWKFNKNIKKFLNLAKKEGLNVIADVNRSELKLKQETADHIYNDLDELERLYNLSLDNKTLEVVRDLFILSSFTALRFSDTKRLNEIAIERHYLNGSPMELLRVTSQKTGEKVLLPCLKPIRELYAKYNGCFPKAPSEQEYNRSLKKLGQLAGITQTVTINTTRNKVETTTHQKFELMMSHTGRRNAVTNYYQMGIPLATLQLISGHKDTKNLMKYIKCTDIQHLGIIYSAVQKAAPSLL